MAIIINDTLRLHTHTAGDLGSIPGQRTRSCILQLKIPHASVEIQDPECYNSDPVQSNKQILKKNNWERAEIFPVGGFQIVVDTLPSRRGIITPHTLV